MGLKRKMIVANRKLIAMKCCSRIMRVRVGTLAYIAAVGLALTGTACGANGVIASPNTNPCAVSVAGTKSKIRPESSGYTCSEVQSILLVLPNAVGTWPLEEGNPSQDEICRVYPKSAFPLEIRCHHGRKRFEVVGVSRSSRRP